KMQDIIQLQRATIDEHIRTEDAKDWQAVASTFIPGEAAYFDVMPLATRFQGMSGVLDFYQTFATALPDFQITVTGEYDTPGCSIREVTINGTHLGEYGGVPASGKRVTFELAGFFLFGTEADAGKVLCERVYFDNEILMRQMRGEADAPTGIGLAALAGAAPKA
ncbi:MAG TPA: ester cyclase, partial [Blastocatellia bacterium]|nr:ester cyclase [Blastocatellia bacterium]